MTRSISCSRPMTGSSLLSRASCVRSRELVEHRRLERLGPDSTGRRGAPASPAAPRRAGAERFEIFAAIDCLLHEAEQEMLGADVVVAELPGSSMESSSTRLAAA